MLKREELTTTSFAFDAASDKRAVLDYADSANVTLTIDGSVVEKESE